MDLVVEESELSLVRHAVEECFATDKDLLDKWHIIAPNTLSACVEKTLKDVSRFDSSFKFFTVFVESKLAAYFGTEFGNYINLIFVKPAFRVKEFMSKFLKEICRLMPDVFFAGLYRKNEPAVKFYSRIADQAIYFMAGKYPAIKFIFRKDSVCH